MKQPNNATIMKKISVNSGFSALHSRSRQSTMYSKANSPLSLYSYFDRTVNAYFRQGRIRTAETYLTTKNSLHRFLGGKDVSLDQITPNFLEAYEYHLRQRHLSHNTISFYVKHLRAVYNKAVDEKLVMDTSPFRHATTSIGKTVKRAISLKYIRQLKEMDLRAEPSKRFARDMFLFSFYTRGMSFVDIALLRKDNLSANQLSYYRKKTSQKLHIHWEQCMQEILDRYSAPANSPYLFSIIRHTTCDPRKQYQKTQHLINRHLKEIGIRLGLPLPLTLYCARHSWASIAHDEGIPLPIISEGMGHDSEKTTRIYLASLQTEVIDRANRKILKLL